MLRHRPGELGAGRRPGRQEGLMAFLRGALRSGAPALGFSIRRLGGAIFIPVLQSGTESAQGTKAPM